MSEVIPPGKVSMLKSILQAQSNGQEPLSPVRANPRPALTFSQDPGSPGDPRSKYKVSFRRDNSWLTSSRDSSESEEDSDSGVHVSIGGSERSAVEELDGSPAPLTRWDKKPAAPSPPLPAPRKSPQARGAKTGPASRGKEPVYAAVTPKEKRSGEPRNLRSERGRAPSPPHFRDVGVARSSEPARAERSPESPGGEGSLLQLMEAFQKRWSTSVFSLEPEEAESSDRAVSSQQRGSGMPAIAPELDGPGRVGSDPKTSNAEVTQSSGRAVNIPLPDSPALRPSPMNVRHEHSRTPGNSTKEDDGDRNPMEGDLSDKGENEDEFSRGSSTGLKRRLSDLTYSISPINLLEEIFSGQEWSSFLPVKSSPSPTQSVDQSESKGQQMRDDSQSNKSLELYLSKDNQQNPLQAVQTTLNQNQSEPRSTVESQPERWQREASDQLKFPKIHESMPSHQVLDPNPSKEVNQDPALIDLSCIKSSGVLDSSPQKDRIRLSRKRKHRPLWWRKKEKTKGDASKFPRPAFFKGRSSNAPPTSASHAEVGPPSIFDPAPRPLASQHVTAPSPEPLDKKKHKVSTKPDGSSQTSFGKFMKSLKEKTKKKPKKESHKMAADDE